ncbi:MAG: CopG family transcriptional regulator [Terracidiphilus sp.]
MRTTITLDDDVHEFVTYFAHSQGISLSAAITELIRKAQTTPEPRPEIRRGLNGMPLLPRSGRTITSEMVKQFSEDDLG